MKLHEALVKTGRAVKHVKGPVAGTHTVSKAHLSAGYYKDFVPDDAALRSPFSTSHYYGFDYPGADPLKAIVGFAGEDDWQAR